MSLTDQIDSRQMMTDLMVEALLALVTACNSLHRLTGVTSCLLSKFTGIPGNQYPDLPVLNLQ